MIHKLTKAKLTGMVSLLNKIDTCCDMAIFYNNGIYPVTPSDDNVLLGYSEKLNGYNFIENNEFECLEGIPLVYTSGCTAELKEHMKLTGLKEIYLLTGDNIAIYIDGKTYDILNPVPEGFVIEPKLYDDFDDRVNELLLSHNWCCSTNDDIKTIINGEVNTIYDREKGLFVRVSKNTFPLMGIVKMDNTEAFKFSYCFSYSKNNNEPCIILIVYYKKFRAIHAFNYIAYNTEDTTNE